jgi:U4/U6.U5 tri-snRNP component SNU23
LCAIKTLFRALLHSYWCRGSVKSTIMSGKAGAYGTQGGGDTDFRKTWDRDEMAKKARDREAKERDEAKERYDAKAAGKSYRRRASTPEDLKQTEARSERIDWSQMIGKQTLTSAAAGVGKRGKGAGAYCQACDLTFKYALFYAHAILHANNHFQRQHTIRRALE